MGVQQQIELQNQSSTDFKYFHLKEDITDELELAKETIPRLSLWGWFTPGNYKNIFDQNSLAGIEGKSSIVDDDNTSTSSGFTQKQSMKRSLNGASIISDLSSSSSSKNLLVHSNDYNGGGSSSISTSDSSDNEDVIQMMDYKAIDIQPLSSAKELESESYSKPNPLSKSSTSSRVYPPSYYCSPIYSDITFSILSAVVCIFSIVYCFLVGPQPIMFAFLVSILVFVSYIFACFSPNNRWYLYSITALSVGLGLTIPSFFQATGAIVIGLGRSTWDAQLVKADSTLLGWIFPMGQMGLFVDQHSAIGPDSFIGELSTEILQLSYISYYIWGYFMEVYILYNLWKCSLSKDPVKAREISIWDQRLKMFICSWISTYFVVFSINLIFPAVSPRVFLRSEYVNNLNGFGFAGFVRGKIENAAKGSFGSFPSGHIATSWAISFASYRILPAYGFVSSIASFLITIATMYLRYHYFVDFLAAIPVAIICLLFGGFYSHRDLKTIGRSIKSFFQNTISKFSKNAKY